MRWVVLVQPTTLPENAQSIHDISFILGVEASKDLEQESFHGVSVAWLIGKPLSLTYRVDSKLPLDRSQEQSSNHELA